MKVVGLVHTRIFNAEHAFAELVLWRVPVPVKGSLHAYKNRLAYVVNGICVVRYDNEAGKGDRGLFGTKRATTPSPPQKRCSLISNVILRGGIVKTVTLDVCSPVEAIAGFAQAWRSGKAEKTARISFASPELLWKVLTAKRWELLKTLCGAGPVSIHEVARRVERDVKAVHTDISALLIAGVLDRTDSGYRLSVRGGEGRFLLQAA